MFYRENGQIGALFFCQNATAAVFKFYNIQAFMVLF